MEGFTDEYTNLRRANPHSSPVIHQVRLRLEISGSQSGTEPILRRSTNLRSCESCFLKCFIHNIWRRRVKLRFDSLERFPPANLHDHARVYLLVNEKPLREPASQIVARCVERVLVTGRSIPPFGGTLHPTVDRVRLNVNNRFVGIVVVRDRPHRAGEFFGDRCLAILPALRVVVPNTKGPVERA